EEGASSWGSRRAVISSTRPGWSFGTRCPAPRSICAPRSRRISIAPSWSPPARTYRSPPPTRSTSLDSTTPTLEPTATPTLLFRVGATVYGCDIGDAQEILPLRPASRLPGAPSYVRGLINVRGTIVTLLDVGARLEPGRAPIESGSILLIRYRERLVGLAV